MRATTNAFCFLLLTGLGLASTSGAQAQEPYPFDLAKKNPKAMQAWRNIVPKDLRSIAWVRDFKGTEIGRAHV